MVFVAILSLFVALASCSAENVRVERHCHKGESYYSEPQLIEISPYGGCKGAGLGSVQFGSCKGPGPGPIIQVVEKSGRSCDSGAEAAVIVIEREGPTPIIISDDEPLRLKHVAEPYIVDNFNTQYIIDHYQGARIEKFQRPPVVVDHYLPAEIKEIDEGGPITVQLDCAGNPVAQLQPGPRYPQCGAEVIVEKTTILEKDGVDCSPW